MGNSRDTIALGAVAVDSALERFGTEMQHASRAQNSSAVVVALPSQMDPIRLVGDEDKHATLLFFGEASSLPSEAKNDLLGTLQQISQMVEPFGERIVGVERLGSEVPPALVAKLNNHYLENLRSIALVNPKLRGYLANAEQFPTFIPHVTLGYPDYQGEAEIRKLAQRLHRVHFDRLALWWGDEQFEFELTNKFEGGSEAAWSADLVANYLAHYGIKGMKWGVRRKNPSGAPLSEDAAIARSILSKKSSSVSSSEIQTALNRMRLEQQFKEIQSQMTPKTRTERAKRFVGKLLGEIGSNEVNRVTKGAAAIAVEQALQKGGKVDFDKEFAKALGKRIVPKKGK